MCHPCSFLARGCLKITWYDRLNRLPGVSRQSRRRGSIMGNSVTNIGHSSISDELLATLKEDIGARRIEHGMERLGRCTSLFESFNPSLKNAAAFLGNLAQWCDVGFGNL